MNVLETRIFYYKNGNIRSSQHFLNGKKCGIHTFYSMEGDKKGLSQCWYHSQERDRIETFNNKEINGIEIMFFY